MINHDSQLKLQAWLDGELPPGEAAGVRDWLAKDAEANALLSELRNTKGALSGGEAELKLPETREFYWSKIEREIRRQDRPAAASTRIPWLAWVQHHFLPVSGVALLSGLLAVLAVHPGKIAGQFAEMELASEDMGSYTFRDQEHRMTMVWFYDRNDDSKLVQPAALASVESE